MNLIGISEGENYELRLWSDTPYEIRTDEIIRLVICVANNLALELQIDARYCRMRGDWWTIRFCWRSENGLEIECNKQIDSDQLSRTYPEIIAGGFCYEIRLANSDHHRLNPPNDSQNWVIVRYRDGFLAGIHQAGKTSVSLILSELTLDRGFSNHTKVMIEAWNPGNAFVRGNSVEVGGMLLQGELLEWLEIGEESLFRFSPNTHQVNISGSSPDEIRVTFSTRCCANTTRPRTQRGADFERLWELGLARRRQIEIPRSGFFDRSLEAPPYEGLGLRTCKNNARSQHLRCAINPCGPCEGCQHYEKI